MARSRSQSAQSVVPHSNQNRESVVPGSTHIKQKRGPTKCKDTWALSKGEKLHIRVNTQGQPIGKNVKKLTNFLGTLARNGAYAPLRYEDWRNMPNYYKTEMWDLVQEKFDIDPFVEPWILSSLSSKWRNFKSSVKRDWFRDKERDERVSNDDWAWLLRFWSTDKAVKREVVGKENRDKVISAHTLGSKSYACKRDEMAESRLDKREPTRAEVYVAAHVRPNGAPLNDKVAKVIEKINEKKTQIEPTHHDSPGPHDILSQALGEDKYHHSRTFGLGSGWGMKSSRLSILKKALEGKRNAEENAEKMKGELHEVRVGQGKIMTLLHKLHPNVSIDELLDSTMQDHVVIESESNGDEMSPTGFGREDENLGRSPLLSMLQDTTPQRTNSQSNEVSPNHILQTYLPHYHGLSSEVNSSDIQNKTSQMPPNKTFSFLDSILDSSHNGGSSTQSQGLEFVILKSLLSPEVNVAYANIITKDPKGCVAGQELGRGFYEVFIHVPFKSDEPLVRPYGSFQTIGDVIGRSIAWPSSLVTFADTQLF